MILFTASASFASVHIEKSGIESKMRDTIIQHKEYLSIPNLITPFSTNIPEDCFLGDTSKYPNPFSPSSIIKFGISSDSYITIELFDKAENEIGILLNEFTKAGSYKINYGALDLPMGIYFFKLIISTEEGVTELSKKLIFVK